MLLSSNVALFGGNSTKPGSSYYALIKAVLLYKDAYRATPLWRAKEVQDLGSSSATMFADGAPATYEADDQLTRSLPFFLV